MMAILPPVQPTADFTPLAEGKTSAPTLQPFPQRLLVHILDIRPDDTLRESGAVELIQASSLYVRSLYLSVERSHMFVGKTNEGNGAKRRALTRCGRLASLHGRQQEQHPRANKCHQPYSRDGKEIIEGKAVIACDELSHQRYPR